MSHNKAHALVFGVQALRRVVERDNQLGGALAMPAWPYAHQVAQVRTILEDVCVRHCIADEVGLGKTVQALAVIRALRIQRPSLKVAIVVPDELMGQWRNEALVRGGFALRSAGEPTEDAELASSPVLWWPALERDAREAWGEVAAAELIVVDELPRLTSALQARVARVAVSAEHVLILTATPPLDAGAAEGVLLGAIEPYRCRVGGLAWGELVRREAAAAEDVEGGRKRCAQVWSASRRLLGTRRRDWRGQLPRREVRAHWFDPVPAELERERALWEWMRVAKDTSRAFDHVRLAQRVRSSASLRQRVTYLCGHGHDRDGLLQRVHELLSEPGDSRFEALCDVLCDVWRDDPTARVLIGANDNLTVDELERRLQAAFDESTSSEALVVAKIRNQREGPGALIDPDDVVERAVKAFRSGAARVLLLTDEGVAGLNLQVTRHVIFYAASWDPVENEQLIGRADRIGNRALADRGDGALVVHLLAQRGGVDERVCRMMLKSGLLETPVAMDRPDVRGLGALITRAGVDGGAAAWSAARAAAEAAVHDDNDYRTRCVLHDALPTSPRWAAARAAEVLDAPAAWPALIAAPAGWEGWSAATRAWLAALTKAGHYQFSGSATGRGVETLSYGLRGHVRHLEDAVERPLPTLPYSGSRLGIHTHRVRFEDRALDRQERGNGHGPVFFDHGAAVHDELVDAWALRPGEHPAHIELSVVPPSTGPLRELAGAVVSLVVGRLDPARLLVSADAQARHEVEADRRFLRGQVRARVVAAGVWARQGAEGALSLAHLEALLGDDGLRLIPSGMNSGFAGAARAGADGLAAARALAEREVVEELSRRRAAVTAALAARVAVLWRDVDDLAEAVERGGDLPGRGDATKALDAMRTSVQRRVSALEATFESVELAWVEHASVVIRM